MLQLRLDLCWVRDGFANDFQEKKTKAFAHSTHRGTKRDFAAAQARGKFSISQSAIAVQERFQFLELARTAQFFEFLLQATTGFVQHGQCPAAVEDFFGIQ